MSDNVALFCRVTPAELRTIDGKAKFAMRSRNSFASYEFHKVLTDQKAAPTEFPGEAPGSESVVLFLRVDPAIKQACVLKAAATNVPLSQWVRAVLTAV